MATAFFYHIEWFERESEREKREREAKDRQEGILLTKEGPTWRLFAAANNKDMLLKITAFVNTALKFALYIIEGE